MEPMYDLFEKLSETTSREECFRQYMSYIERFGLTNGMLISLTGGSPTEENAVITYDSTYDAKFTEEYLSLGGARNDISAQLLINSPQLQFHFHLTVNNENRQSIYNRPLTREEIAIEELSNDFGIVEGFAVELTRTGGYTSLGAGVSAVGMTEKEYIKDVLPLEQEIRRANRLLEVSIQRFDKSSTIALPAKLTVRQQDILRWLAHGYRLQEIAENKVYRSIHTINKEMHSLKVKLNARTQEELVAKGILWGLID